MKTKKLSKKLGLNKKTIADFNSNALKDVFGKGIPPIEYTDPIVCPTQDTICGTNGTGGGGPCCC